MSPMRRELYPENWDRIATEIKESTDWTCQVCGKQCHRPGERVLNTQDVLTVAHINHVESDCRPENLVAACSVCHLQYDAKRRRWQNLAKKRIRCESRNVLFPKGETKIKRSDTEDVAANAEDSVEYSAIIKKNMGHCGVPMCPRCESQCVRDKDHGEHPSDGWNCPSCGLVDVPC